MVMGVPCDSHKFLWDPCQPSSASLLYKLVALIGRMSYSRYNTGVPGSGGREAAGRQVCHKLLCSFDSVVVMQQMYRMCKCMLVHMSEATCDMIKVPGLVSI